jgi:microsomal epoxide hydrolase
LAYGLTDSPVGQLAWITEKFFEWTDSSKTPEDAITRDQLLTNVSLYWLTATAGSSAQLYYEMADVLPISPTPPPSAPPHPVPLEVAVYAHDASLAVRRLAEQRFPNIIQWNEFDRGGHFPAMEQPDLFVADLRSFATALTATADGAK